MTEVENRCGEIKATLEKLTGVKCSSTARLVAVLMACGIESTTEIAKLIGKTDRMVRVARKEISASGNPLPETDCRRKPVAGNQLPNAETDFRPRAHAPAQMESPSGISLSQEVEDTPLPPKVDQLGRPIEGPEAEIFLENGKLSVVAGQRRFWLKEFGGDEKRLNLALIEIAPKLLPNGRQPIYAQVGSQLARIAGQRHDQQKRYDSARAEPRMSHAQAQAERARELMRLTA